MGQFVLSVDPNAVNKAALGAIVNDFNGRPGASQFLNLTNRSGSGSIYVTDNPNSSLWTDANKARMQSFGLDNLRGYSQAVGSELVTYVNLNDTSGKPAANVVAHEVGHIKWPGLGNDALGHDPAFYRLLSDSLKALGFPVDRRLDLNGVDVDNVPPPQPAGTNPLNYNIRQKKSDAGGDESSADLAYSDDQTPGWQVTVSGDGTMVREVKLSPDGDVLGIIEYTGFPANGTRIDTLFNVDGGRVVTTTDLANSFDWSREIKRIHPDGLFEDVKVGDDGNVSSLQYSGGTVTAGDIAGVFGSNLGGMLGGNTIGGQIAAGTVIGAVGKEIGNALQYNFSLDNVVGEAFGSLNGGIGSFPSAGIGALSSLLMGELFDTIHLAEPARALFQGIGTSATTQLVTNAYGMATGAVVQGTGLPYTIGTGFNPGQIIPNIGAVVGGILGKTLGAQVVSAHFQEGALGGSIGSSIGSSVGAAALQNFAAARCKFATPTFRSCSRGAKRSGWSQDLSRRDAARMRRPNSTPTVRRGSVARRGARFLTVRQPQAAFCNPEPLAKPARTCVEAASQCVFGDV